MHEVVSYKATKCVTWNWNGRVLGQNAFSWRCFSVLSQYYYYLCRKTTANAII